MALVTVKTTAYSTETVKAEAIPEAGAKKNKKEKQKQSTTTIWQIYAVGYLCMYPKDNIRKSL